MEGSSYCSRTSSIDNSKHSGAGHGFGSDRAGSACTTLGRSRYGNRAARRCPVLECLASIVREWRRDLGLEGHSDPCETECRTQSYGPRGLRGHEYLHQPSPPRDRLPRKRRPAHRRKHPAVPVDRHDRGGPGRASSSTTPTSSSPVISCGIPWRANRPSARTRFHGRVRAPQRRPRIVSASGRKAEYRPRLSSRSFRPAIAPGDGTQVTVLRALWR